MPFDSISSDPFINAKKLSALLRDKSQWPYGFEWNYHDPNRCALGLMFKTGMINQKNDFDEIGKVLNIPENTINGIVIGAYFEEYSQQNITPENVADLIDFHVKDLSKTLQNQT